MFNHSEIDKGPGVRVPPPVIFGGFILAALGLNEILPSAKLDITVIRIMGWGLCFGAIVIAGITVGQFLRAGTNIEPWKPDTKLIRSGLYQYSRNPIYLAFVVFTVGLGLSLDIFWVAGSVVPSVWVLHRLVILKEEEYLVSKFGQEYTDYCEQVRRWL